MILHRTMDAVESLILAFVGLATVMMLVHVCADVVGKNVFNRSLPGTIAIVSNYYMPIITFVPLVLAQRYGQHISVDVLFDKFPRTMQKHLTGMTYLYAAMIFGLLAYFGWEEAMTKYRSGTFVTEYGIRIPTWPGYFTPAVGYGMIAVYVLLHFTRYALDLVTPSPMPKGPKEE